MTTIEWLFSAAGNRVLIGLVAGLIFFVIYFAVDVLFFLTRRDFRRVNVYMLHFTRNNPGEANASKREKEKAQGGDALEKLLFLDAVPLRQLYHNRFIFWRLFWATRSATETRRLLRLGNLTTQILRPICYRCAVNAGAVAKRGAGFATKRQKYLAVFAYDRTPGRNAYTYSLFLVCFWFKRVMLLLQNSTKLVRQRKVSLIYSKRLWRRIRLILLMVLAS